MKKLTFRIGLFLLAMGLGVILSMFLPDKLLVGILALLLIVAGLLILLSK